MAKQKAQILRTIRAGEEDRPGATASHTADDSQRHSRRRGITAREVVDTLERRGARFSIEGGKLVVTAGRGVIDDEMREGLEAFQAEILAIITDRRKSKAAQAPVAAPPPAPPPVVVLPPPVAPPPVTAAVPPDDIADKIQVVMDGLSNEKNRLLDQIEAYRRSLQPKIDLLDMQIDKLYKLLDFLDDPLTAALARDMLPGILGTITMPAADPTPHRPIITMPAADPTPHQPTPPMPPGPPPPGPPPAPPQAAAGEGEGERTYLGMQRVRSYVESILPGMEFTADDVYIRSVAHRNPNDPHLKVAEFRDQRKQSISIGLASMAKAGLLEVVKPGRGRDVPAIYRNPSKV